MGEGWRKADDGWTRAYSALAMGAVAATGHSYGPPYKWTLQLGGMPLTNGHALTSSEAMAAADDALDRWTNALGR